MKHWLPLLACTAALAAPAQAGPYDPVIEAQIRPGWRLPDGSHMAGLELRLAPGWKTYWRAPGEAGIPPIFRWQSPGLSEVSVLWPTPHIFESGGMRSVGYHDTVVLPLRLRFASGAPEVDPLSVEVDLGICKDICLPHSLSVSATLDQRVTQPDPVIAAALADLPLTAQEAGIGAMQCTLTARSYGMDLRTEVTLPDPGGAAETLVETADPTLWVTRPNSWWEGARLISEVELHPSEGIAALDRSGVRMTVLRPGHMAVDLMGCGR